MKKKKKACMKEVRHNAEAAPIGALLPHTILGTLKFQLFVVPILRFDVCHPTATNTDIPITTHCSVGTRYATASSFIEETCRPGGDEMPSSGHIAQTK